MQQGIEDFLEAIEHLHLIEQKVIETFSLHLLLCPGQEVIRAAECCILAHIECHLDNVVLRNALIDEPVPEEFED